MKTDKKEEATESLQLRLQGEEGWSGGLEKAAWSEYRSQHLKADKKRAPKRG